MGSQHLRWMSSPRLGHPRPSLSSHCTSNSSRGRSRHSNSIFSSSSSSSNRVLSCRCRCLLCSSNHSHRRSWRSSCLACSLKVKAAEVTDQHRHLTHKGLLLRQIAALHGCRHMQCCRGVHRALVSMRCSESLTAVLPAGGFSGLQYGQPPGSAPQGFSSATMPGMQPPAGTSEGAQHKCTDQAVPCCVHHDVPKVQPHIVNDALVRYGSTPHP